MTYRNASVASIVITILVAVTTLLLGTFGMINHALEKNRRLAILRDELRGEADQLSIASALPIWNIDRDQIDKVVESTFNNRNIYAIEVTAAGRIHSRVRDAQWRVVSAGGSIQAPDLFEEDRAVTFSGEAIGMVKVFFSPKIVEEEMQKSLISTFANIILLDLILTVSLYLLFWRVVLRPLKIVGQYASSVTSGNEITATVDSMRFRGELESLRLSIRQMVRLLETRYQQLQEKVQELLASEARYRVLVENTPDIIARFDRDGRYTFINSAVKHVSTLKPEDFIGKTVWNVGFTEEQAKERQRLIREIVESGKPVETELAFEGVGGPEVYEWRAFPELDATGAVQSVVSINRNITARKKAEEALRASMDQLHSLAQRLERIREEERRTISHEVHDQLGQLLTGLTMDLVALRKAGPSQKSTFDTKIASSLSLTGKAIEIVKDISARLRPGMLDHLGLLPAVEWQTEEFQKHSGIQCSVRLPDHEPAIDSERATTLFRILQETLTNVARHANAKHVEVRLTESPDAVSMSIIDDGMGISPDRIHDPKSLGLLGIRERLFPFKGICTIQAGTHGGTEVHIRLPR
jgi:PAS domain S-box-containing protein